MSVTLKDGSRVEDPRLGRLKDFDQRSRNYGVIRTLTPEQQRKPRSWTWTCNKWLDQLAEGSCAGHAFAHELAARPVVVPNMTHEYAVDIYYGAQDIDPWPGGARPGDSPFYEGTSVLAAIKIVRDRGLYTGFNWAFGEEQLFLGLGWNGPAVLGIPWHASMSNPDSKGFVHLDGNVVGGHAILCNGVSVRGGYYRLHNSWGRSNFGLGGDCFISREDMRTLLQDEGECVFPFGRSLGGPQ